MSREVRRVPKDWQHPKDGSRFRPLHDSFNENLARYKEEAVQWALGNQRGYLDGQPWMPRDSHSDGVSYEEWAGSIPKQEDYMPDWPEAERTHLQMYETCTEGSPISPVMATAEELAHWLADNGASAFGSMTASYDEWLATIKAGWAPTAVHDGTGMHSGVEAVAKLKQDDD